MGTFFSYRRVDSDIVHRVKSFMESSVPDIVALYDGPPVLDFLSTMRSKLASCLSFVLFLPVKLGDFQDDELKAFSVRMTGDRSRLPEAPEQPARQLVIVCLCDKEREKYHFENDLILWSSAHRVYSPGEPDLDLNALSIAKDLTQALGVPWQFVDGLPLDPHLFNYEKDIIQHYQNAARLFPDGTHAVERDDADPDRRIAWDIYQKWLKGCPGEWLDVPRFIPPLSKDPSDRRNPLIERVIGKYRPAEARVLVKALRHEGGTGETAFTFPEAGPRGELHFRPDQNLKVAIMVSGGIAPGVNAVIDGIVQRHWQYAKGRRGELSIYGLTDGFLSLGNWRTHSLILKAEKKQPKPEDWNSEPVLTPDHAHEGGSIVGTSRVGALLHSSDRIEKFEEIERNLGAIDILYVIGGDGTMKAAHALYEIARQDKRRVKRLSVVAIPKTMDNDILWVWQSFGFLSAVEKGREVIEHLSTEVQSNPRLCIVQLFGSDSGFVVSHAVLASATGHCIAALIPEVKFSMGGLIAHLREKLRPTGSRPPHGIVVMAETAIPTDAIAYLDDPDVALTDEEKESSRRSTV